MPVRLLHSVGSVPDGVGTQPFTHRCAASCASPRAIKGVHVDRWLSALLALSHGSPQVFHPIPVLFSFCLLLSLGAVCEPSSSSLSSSSRVCLSVLWAGTRHVSASRLRLLPVFRFFVMNCVPLMSAFAFFTVTPFLPFGFHLLPLFRDFAPVCHRLPLLLFLAFLLPICAFCGVRCVWLFVTSPLVTAMPLVPAELHRPFAVPYPPAAYKSSLAPCPCALQGC